MALTLVFVKTVISHMQADMKASVVDSELSSHSRRDELKSI